MQYFYNEMSKKYVIAFAHLFSDLNVQTLDSNNQIIGNSKVPIVYATKKKMYYEIKQLPTVADTAIVSTFLPRMGFYISGIQYDSTRKFNNTLQITNTNSIMEFPGVPYNYTFELSILCSTQEQLFQIVEQIATKFTPDLTITIKEIPNIIYRDVSLNLDNVNLSSNFEYDDLSDRTISGEMTFTLKGYMYPIVNVDTDTLIDTIYTSYKFFSQSYDYSVTVTQTQASISADIIKTIQEVV